MTDQPEKPDMDYLSAAFYAGGKDGVQVAEQWVTTLLDAHANLRENRPPGNPLPNWEDMSHEALARKIVGRLLDAGWKPPTDEERTAAVEWVEEGNRRYDAWWKSLTDAERAECLEYGSKHGEFPAHLRPPR